MLSAAGKHRRSDMLKRRFLIGFSALSIAAFGLTSLSYAREAQPNDARGRQDIQVQDDRGADRLIEVQPADDNGVDVAPHARGGDDNGIDPAPHARGGDDNGVDPAPHARGGDDNGQDAQPHA
jgi:hypothetical protein